MEDDFEAFINNRLDNNYDRLLKNDNYQKTDKEYEKMLEELTKSLDNNHKKKLEDVLILRNSLANYEIYLAYKLGFCDFLKIIK